MSTAYGIAEMGDAGVGAVSSHVLQRLPHYCLHSLHDALLDVL